MTIKLTSFNIITTSSGGSAQVVVGTTVKNLDNIPVKQVILKADDDNSGNVFVCIENNECNTSNGFRLKAGQGITLEINNLNKIFLVADSDNQKIHVIWVA